MKEKIFVLTFTLIICIKICNGQNLTGFNPLGGGDNYKVSSIVFTSVNATLTTLNVINYNHEKRSQENGGFAMVTGLAQIIYCGIYSKNISDAGYTILNYSVGTITSVIGGLRLFKKKKQQSAVAYYLYSYPTGSDTVIALGVTINLN